MLERVAPSWLAVSFPALGSAGKRSGVGRMRRTHIAAKKRNGMRKSHASETPGRSLS
jgi:hypothetical protein